ncbi:MAG: NapC/NirT family cytochrome c, partial [Thermoplasmata archaeon]
MLELGVEKMIFVESLIVFAIIALIWLLISALIFKKLNKARIKGVILILLAFVGVAAAIFAVGHFLEWHETSEFCTSMGCHAMEPVYDSYTQPDNNSYMETHYEHNVTCAQCHSGPGITGLAGSFLAVPGEVWGQYIAGYDPDDLGGHVPSENCLKGCHEEYEVDWKFEAPRPEGEGYSEVNGKVVWLRMTTYHPDTVNGTDLSELEELEDCKECHDPRDNGFGLAAEACHVCHEVDSEEMELHGVYTCHMAACHPNEEGEAGQPKLRGHAVVKGHCAECHSRNHPEDATVPYTVITETGTFTANTSFCSGCHHDAYSELETAGSKHFTSNECQECHLSHKTRPDCLLCHDEGGAYEPQHALADPFDDCGSCHVQGGHNPLNVALQTHDSGTVSRDFCNACHQSDVYDRFEMEELHFREGFVEDCLACHGEHEADVDCDTCHVENGYGGLLDDPGHTTSEPFDECPDCHTDGHDPSDLNFTHFREQQETSIGQDFCVNCHYEETGQYHLAEKLELDNSGMGHALQDCASCHEAHEEDVDCQECH